MSVTFVNVIDRYTTLFRIGCAAKAMGRNVVWS